eukprot:COSAG06_NODE_372_length_16686_cov_16.467354_16_plen_81_part_00
MMMMMMMRRRSDSVGCEKRLFLSHLYLNTIILPRQARDKHGESTQKREIMRFVQGDPALEALMQEVGLGAKNATFCATFI